jgi:hypothetical protein
MLPRRIPKPKKRSQRWRSLAHCSFVRSHECCVPGCTARPIEVAHVRRGSDGGMGRKPSDWNVLSLCRDHHAEQHRIGEESFEQRYKIDLRRLADMFAISSPRAIQIREAKADG